MRSIAALTAVLALAAPAAAQPEKPDELNQLATELYAEALERAHQNVPASVSDYVLSLSFGPTRAELYVRRDGDGWQVVAQDDAPIASLFKDMVLWPRMAAEHRPGAAVTSEAVRDARYVTSDTVGDQVAHVLRARMPGLAVEGLDLPDSTYVLLDARTRQVLRVMGGGDVQPSGSGVMANGGRVTMELTFGRYEAVNGVTVPRRMGIRMLMRDDLTDTQRTEMRSGMTSRFNALAGDTSQRALQTRVRAEMVLRILNGQSIDISVTVDDVRVNTGPPAWMARQGG